MTYLSLLLPRNHKPLNYLRNSGSPLVAVTVTVLIIVTTIMILTITNLINANVRISCDDASLCRRKNVQLKNVLAVQ